MSIEPQQQYQSSQTTDALLSEKSFKLSLYLLSAWKVVVLVSVAVITYAPWPAPNIPAFALLTSWFFWEVFLEVVHLLQIFYKKLRRAISAEIMPRVRRYGRALCLAIGL